MIFEPSKHINNPQLQWFIDLWIIHIMQIWRNKLLTMLDCASDPTMVDRACIQTMVDWAFREWSMVNHG